MVPVSWSRVRAPKLALCSLLWLLVTLAAAHARADVGVRVGPHGGVAVSHDTDPYVGFGLRLTAPSSPLTLQPTFDYVFEEDRTLYHLGGNLLYELPVAFRLKPYFGVGARFSAFALDQESATVDSEGYRLGMNLLAGARLQLPWVSPFVQVTKGVGELDALAVGGGVELTLREQSGARAAPPPMSLLVTPYLANNVVGDVQSGRLGMGLSLAVFPWEYVGFEIDGQLHGHFFRDEGVADLAPEGVDLNTAAALISASGVLRYCARGASYGTWCPYVTAGVGAIHAWFDGIARAPSAPSIARSQTDPALSGGVGISHSFTRHVALRVDGRYFRAFVDESASAGGYFEDYGFLRVSAGVSIGF